MDLLLSYILVKFFFVCKFVFQVCSEVILKSFFCRHTHIKVQKKNLFFCGCELITLKNFIGSTKFVLFMSYLSNVCEPGVYQLVSEFR